MARRAEQVRRDQSGRSRSPHRSTRGHRERRGLQFEDRLGLIGGGIIGTLLRVAVRDALPRTAGEVPWSTLAINVGGTFVLAVILAHWRRSDLTGRALKSLHAAVATGVIGGFTTFSDFAVEVVDLATSDLQLGIAYAAGSVVAGLAAALVGVQIAASQARKVRT